MSMQEMPNGQSSGVLLKEVAAFRRCPLLEGSLYMYVYCGCAYICTQQSVLLMFRVPLIVIMGKHPVCGWLCSHTCVHGLCFHGSAFAVDRKHPRIGIQMYV